MSDVVGWHQAPYDPSVSRYWDGQQWRGELRWDGSRWASTDHGVPAMAPSAGPPSVAVAGSEASRSAWALGIAAVLSVVGIFLPLATVSYLGMGGTTTSFGDDGGVAALLLAIAALVAWVSWPARVGHSLGWGRIVALVLVALFWSGAVLSNWGDLADGQEQLAGSAVSIEPGAGLYAFGMAMVSIWIGIALAVRDRLQLGATH